MASAAGRAVVVALAAVLVTSAMGLAASQTFINKTGGTVSGIKIEFSKSVRIITRHDSVFPDQSPSGRSDTFTFSSGELHNFGRFNISWVPSSAKVTDYEWTDNRPTVEQQEPSVPTIEKDTFQVDIKSAAGDTSVKAEVQREILRGQLPFTVRYTVSLPTNAGPYSFYWDVDKYVDSDGDDNAADDHDNRGVSIELEYAENYNPTITLHVVDETSADVAVWEDMIRNDFVVGKGIRIDGKGIMSLRGINADDVVNISWTQRHMEKMSFVYMTEYQGQITDPTAFNTNLVCKYPGKYVLDMALTKSDGSSEHVPVVAWVVRTFPHTKPVGFMMADLWNEYYDQQDNRMANVSMFFSDYDAVHKLDYLQNQGFQSIDVMNMFAMTHTQPYPEITNAAEGIHHINDQDLSMIFNHIPKGNLDWETYYFGSGPSHWTDFEHLSRAYYEHFFEQYDAHVLQEAALAEKLGLPSFMFGFQHPYLWGLCSIEAKSEADARFVRDQWISLCDKVRKVFHGEVGLGVPDRCSFAAPITRHVDFIYENLGNFGGHAAEIQWAKSVEDLRVAYGSYLDKYVGALYPLFRIPIRFTFWAYSYDDGSTRGWIPENEQDTYDSWNDKYRWGGYSQQILEGKTNPKYPPNFREQVKMIEAMMPMLGERHYIKEIVSEYEHWKLSSFHNFNPDNVIDYFQVFTGNMQGKPGFQAYKLWASILDPNDRLAYRHVLEPRPENKIVIGNKQFITDSGIDWADVPYAAAVPEGYTPATYWGNNGQEDISTSQHWNLPGHDLKGIRCTFKGQNLAVRWETFKPDIKAGFTFELQFNSPGNPDATVYIDVNPRDKRAEVHLQTGGKDYYLESSIAAFAIDPSQTALYLKDIKLPEALGSLHDLQDWPVSAFVIFRSNSGNEYYNIPVVSDRIAQEAPVIAAEETISTLVPNVESIPYIYSIAPNAKPDEYWREGEKRDFSEAKHWGLSGSQLKGVKVRVSDKGLLVYWETYDSMQSSSYTYDVRFYLPGSKNTALFVEVTPSGKIAQANMEIDGSWQDVSSAVIASDFKEHSAATFLKPIELGSNIPFTALQDAHIITFINYNEGGNSYEAFGYTH